MKTKLPILIAAGLFFASISKAQYGSPFPESRVVIQGQVVIPGRAVVAYEYNNMPRARYDEYRNRKEAQFGRYDDRRDRRYDEYERYCRSHHGHKISRDDFYRSYSVYRVEPNCEPKRVIVYNHY